MSGKTRMFLASLLVAVIGMTGLATPAQAVAPMTGVTATAQAVSGQERAFTDCAVYPGTVCFHQYGNFTGRVWRQTPDEIGSCRNLAPDNFNDTASTAFNNIEHSYSVRIYQHENCTGSYKILVSGYYYVFTGDWWDNRTSSVRLIAA